MASLRTQLKVSGSGYLLTATGLELSYDEARYGLWKVRHLAISDGWIDSRSVKVDDLDGSLGMGDLVDDGRVDNLGHGEGFSSRRLTCGLLTESGTFVTSWADLAEHDDGRQEWVPEVAAEPPSESIIVLPWPRTPKRSTRKAASETRNLFFAKNASSSRFSTDDGEAEIDAKSNAFSSFDSLDSSRQGITVSLRKPLRRPRWRTGNISRKGGSSAEGRSGKVDLESYAVVKNSPDPYSDFRESMVEMIVEKEMYGAEDLERLLQCFFISELFSPITIKRKNL
ncbi:uncharacterized protein LOC127790164 [Diospyros lotus]|uniref:uncharacterized protein LOC127790164 n=1 Tax=Diospyros lotus TaxID=55363 RepID=UPI002256F6A9|nr:uncharacterized protein LOC127790164 [Diospyros lotus]